MLDVAILAGGLATRLRPLTETIPKSLVPINDEPFVAHQLRLLHAKGFEHVVMCVGHMGLAIKDFVGEGQNFGLRVEYSWDGPSQLGTAGAIRNALPNLGSNFFVMYGDSYLTCDYLAVEAAFFKSGKRAIMTVFCNEGQWDASNVELQDGQIVRYDKNTRSPRMNHIDYGLGVFQRTAFLNLRTESCDLASLYQTLLIDNELSAFEVNERFYEVGSFEGLQMLSSRLSMSDKHR